MVNIIGPFEDDYAFLSNFFLHEISYNGISFKSTEHCYQAMKATNYNDILFVKCAITAAQAKRNGKMIDCRPDWDIAKFKIMKDICKIKFEDPILKQKLINTGTNQLIEINNWNDTIWGMIYKNNKLCGENHLGKILMEIRSELISKPIFKNVIKRITNSNDN